MKKNSKTEVLHIENLCVSRGRYKILRGINWTINQREHWVIVGSNGSGKTTLLGSLLGYFAPSEGSIRLLGNTYGEYDWRELRLKIGIVSSALSHLMDEEEPALLTVASGKFAMLGLWGRITTQDRNRASRLLSQVGCARLAESPWGVLSQGERQRVLIARALMTEPELLILDEPCAGLDPAAREDFLHFIPSLPRRFPRLRSVVLVTHHVEEIVPFFTHALLLKDGRTSAAGPIASTLTSSNLSTAFGRAVKISRVQGRYLLRFTGNKTRAFA